MADTPRSTGFSLRRWSQRKLAAARGEPDLQRSDRPAADARTKSSAVAEARAVAPGEPRPTRVATPPASTTATNPETTGITVSLPPLDSLTIDSDFSPFMQPGVDEGVKRMALRKLLRDPRFNVMDGLDVYIDDYSKPSPLEPALVRTLAQARYIFDPPKTRVTAEGVVEDVPDEPAAMHEEAGDVAAAAALPSEAEVRAVDDQRAQPTAGDLDPPAAMIKRSERE